jgi:CRISPR type III-B/RAMP module RAMP protein Cmr6
MMAPKGLVMPNQLERSLPLYAGVGFFAPGEGRGFAGGLPAIEPHPGLVFDKFIDTWQIEEGGNCSVQQPATGGDRRERNPGSKRAWLQETMMSYRNAERTLNTRRAAAVTRHQAFVEGVLRGCCVPMRTDWRLVSGLGNGHPFETGFVWHRTLGIPYLPGSAVKGLVRAWADPEKGWGGITDRDQLDRLFGDTSENGAGQLIVFDALPLSVPSLELDIMNPHYADYYEGKKPPADYLSPKPVFFLTVESKQPFLFSLAPRPGSGAGKNEVEEGEKLLIKALNTLGAGGKTAVGYGRMTLGITEATPARTKPQYKVRDRIIATRVEDPKGRGRVWFESDDGFGGRVTQGAEPATEIGGSVELWVVAVSSGYNFSSEPPTPLKDTQKSRAKKIR